LIRISANRIITLSGPVLQNGIIELDNSGYITAVREAVSREEIRSADFFEGMLTPGFVNTHCHLELSRLKGMIGEKKGLGHFIGEINHLRPSCTEEIIRAAGEADRILLKEGVVAAGDIANTSLTVDIKKKSPIEWFTFAETFGFHPSRAVRAIETALSVHHAFKAADLDASVVPHSPYSVSKELFAEIRALEGSASTILSMHNQESEEENLFFRTGEGPILDHISRNLGLDVSHWHPSGKSSLQTVLPELSPALPLLLVHNTCMTPPDAGFLKNSRNTGNTWLVLCPLANLYIEDRIPPVEMFRSEGLQICIGTDSLASNHSLSVLSEIKTLQHYFPAITAVELFTWACMNGACALGMQDRYGSLEVGKKPGILGITSPDPERMSLTQESEVHRLA
jgi:aminodeoxyfutalosine deaminase